jgi:bla regulator protein blaR1
LNAPGTLRARGIPLEALTRMMSNWLDDHRLVRDETGLTGRFDVDLKWTPDRQPLLPLDVPPEVGRAVAAIDPNGPSLFTAVQEQLGLKLESRKEQNDVIVIDHVEKPTPD